MGVVYEAIDPELGRSVALKVVKRKPGDEGQRPRLRELLRREAQSMARVSHPHVVSVFDVGQEGDDDFIAMELVRGSTLTAFRDGGASGAALLKVCLQAGRGVASAHGAGVIHCDLKPDNVLVTPEGSARVTDFGLASAWNPAAPALLGTPAFLAPEVLNGAAADARSDQFSFCRLMVEALASSGSSPRSLSGVTDRRVRRLLQRGLSPDPSQRFPSMNALLDALDAAGRVPRRQRQGAAVVALIVAAVATSSWWAGRDASRCAASADAVDAVWNAQVRRELLSAFDGHGPWAAEAGLKASETFDRFARDWRTSHRAACAATWEERTQSPALLDARLTCLRARLVELRAAVELLRTADKSVALRALAVTNASVPVASCDDQRALATLLGDLDVGEAPEALRMKLASAWALRAAGKPAEALEQSQAVVREATTSPALEAESRLLVALMSAQTQSPDLARPRLNEAILAAERARHDRVRLRALIASAFHEAQWEAFEASDAQARLAEAVLSRVGRGGDSEARLANAIGVRLIRQGKFREALAPLRQARAVWLAQPSPRRADAAIALNAMSVALGQLDDVPAAEQAIHEALTLLRAEGGEAQAELPSYLVTAGAVAHRKGDFDRAAVLYQDAVRLLETFYGPAAPPLALPLINLAMLEEDRGRLSAAEAWAVRAMAVGEATDPDGRELASARAQVASLALRRGDFTRAAQLARLVVGQRARSLGPTHGETLDARGVLGRALVGAGEATEGLSELEAALELARAQGSPLLMAALQMNRGEALLGIGRANEAALDLREAAAFYLARPGREALLGAEVAFSAARAEALSGARAHSSEWAKTALQRFRELGSSARAEEVQRWLDLHR